MVEEEPAIIAPTKVKTIQLSLIANSHENDERENEERGKKEQQFGGRQRK